MPIDCQGPVGVFQKGSEGQTHGHVVTSLGLPLRGCWLAWLPAFGVGMDGDPRLTRLSRPIMLVHCGETSSRPWAAPRRVLYNHQ